MTDLIISIIILAAWTLAWFAVWLRMRQLDRRRARRAQLRRIMVYRISREQQRSLPDNVYELDPHSRKVG